MRISHRGLLVIVAAIGLCAVAGLVVLWPPASAAPDPGEDFAHNTTVLDATLLEVEDLGEETELLGMLPGATSVRITARLEDTDETVVFEMTDDTGDMYRAGQRVRLAAVESDVAPTTYFVNDFRRGPAMLVLAAMFVAAVLALGRFQGVRALIGLVATFGVIIAFIVPAILAGRSPVAVALVGCVIVMIATLYLSHGFNAKTTAAMVGTAGALALTVLLAGAFVSAAEITGLTSEEARLANFEVGGLSLRGLLLAGIIIGGLGVLDDVTMSQASTVFALRRAKPSAGFAELTRSALSVGRDHIAATVNTLFLAYAGAALPLLILFTTSTDGLAAVATSEIVAVEIVRTLVGSIGLVAAVPLTTALAAAVALGEQAATDGQAVAVDPHLHAHLPPAAAPPEPLQHAQQEKPAGPPPAGPPPTEHAAPASDDDEIWVQRLRGAYRLPTDDEAG